jgi:hypothetical protein
LKGCILWQSFWPSSQQSAIDEDAIAVAAAAAAGVTMTNAARRSDDDDQQKICMLNSVLRVLLVFAFHDSSFFALFVSVFCL